MGRLFRVVCLVLNLPARCDNTWIEMLRGDAGGDTLAKRRTLRCGAYL